MLLCVWTVVSVTIPETLTRTWPAVAVALFCAGFVAGRLL